MKKILFIDNYDSFSYIIVYYLKELGYDCKVIKNDSFKKAKELKKFNFTHLIISPGPNSPKESKMSLKAIKYFKKKKKILGICLGHQCIAEVFGGEVSPMEKPMHGKISKLYFKKDPLFKGIKKENPICLYHSLHISTMPKSCKILAHNSQNIIMAIKHKKYDIYGLQFHPEAILTQKGKILLKNFMEL
ncbi:aminodeoxychorismate/anthranilate synthase component II [Campylobacter sp. VicNov18]|uniref:anthranilate synthase component II n=1 Tax=Campylobacter bilis TaxID=2691918 RepID=UPI00130D76C3|nr:aminodeoxychorismate/anthranilate synthase component II [Campylobacter bilis]MPV63536.1 aminodeoxychorismate/anthranilate synthase component II [Campylobacter hepaticus]MBM0637036.1 aminodeoxychorismate/anthranilate synthase component II [Campylobacter bilis]MCC8277807.1 aminodeoxychorismate/anthranilate synthase component II [Campylobacter bilis]MCC8299416.1 aminodeoxychorismate/anthranilate synthase component II [Campylobacter bilis]MCC8300716.1 aminodeoxychorismate/anthranilate synthase 